VLCNALLLEHLILSCESCLFSRQKKKEFAFEPSLLITTGDLIVTLVVLHTFASSVSLQILVFQLVFPRSFSSLGRDVPLFGDHKAPALTVVVVMVIFSANLASLALHFCLVF
jgi:hypothetical protein